MSADKEFLSLEEVAEMLGVHYQLIYKLVRSGELPAARLGRVYRVIRKDLDAYLEKSKSSQMGGTECGVCGKIYYSRSSVAQSCTTCGEPICTDCWDRRGIRVCAKHSSDVQNKIA